MRILIVGIGILVMAAIIYYGALHLFKVFFSRSDTEKDILEEYDFNKVKHLYAREEEIDEEVNLEEELDIPKLPKNFRKQSTTSKSKRKK